MKHKHSGVYYATRTAVRFLLLAAVLLGLYAFIDWSLRNMIAAYTICFAANVVLAGCLWFHWGERAVALIRRHK